MAKALEDTKESASDSELLDETFKALSEEDNRMPRADMPTKAQKLVRENKSLKKKLEDATKEASDLASLNEVLKKGDNPPCWYEVTTKKDTGERHEKSHYLMDIGMRDGAA